MIFLIISVYTTNSHASSQLPPFLWGEKVDTNIQLGAAYTHYPKARSDPRYHPYVGVTYKSINVAYVQNCSYDNSFGGTIQRNLKSYSRHDHKFAIGYRAGAAYGWCYSNHAFATKSDPSCRGVLPIIPVIELVTSYQYKKVGLELDVFGNAFALNFIYFL